jgi:hypothetical protein
MYKGKANKANLLVRQGIFNQTCTDLVGPNPTPLEKLLVERIVVSQQHLFLCESIYASEAQTGTTEATDIHHQKCITMAQKRYTDAIKSLAQIRKLQLPMTLQVNIGEKQINVTSEGTPQSTSQPG